MARRLNHEIEFAYIEDLTTIQLAYNHDMKEVILELNRHGLAMLADICAVFADLPAVTKEAIWEDEHWERVETDAYALTIVVDNTFPSGFEENSRCDT